MRYLLLFIPIAIVSEFVFHNQLLVFVSAAFALIALSGLLGEAIEILSIYTSDKIGALLNATLGNAAELIFTIIALKAGHITLVKASIVGAILGNLLVLPGLGMLLGGLKNGRQYFNRDAAGVNSTMMTLSVAGLMLPTVFELLHEVQNKQGYTLDITDKSLTEYSLGIAGVLIVVYLLSLLYSFTSKPLPQQTSGVEKESLIKEADEKKTMEFKQNFTDHGRQYIGSDLYERFAGGLGAACNSKLSYKRNLFRNYTNPFAQRCGRACCGRSNGV